MGAYIDKQGAKSGVKADKPASERLQALPNDCEPMTRTDSLLQLHESQVATT